MAYDSRKLSIIVGQAAHPLHATLGRVATGLIDVQGNGRMLFSNSMLSYVNGAVVASVARDYAAQHQSGFPHMHQHPLEDSDLFLFLVVLDERHVFVAVGQERIAFQIEEFYERLKTLLFTQVK